jgi:hypothetical protein
MFDSLVQTISAAILSAGGTGVILYFVFKHVMKPVDSYLEEKGKNLATHEDIQKLVDQVRETEKVKAEITDNVWDRQQRWIFKQAMYRELLESLNSLYQAQESYWIAESREKPHTELQKLRIKETSAKLTLSIDAFHKLVQVSALYADTDSYRIVREIVDSPNEGFGLMRQMEDAVEAFAESARKDLDYPPLNVSFTASRSGTKDPS